MRLLLGASLMCALVVTACNAVQVQGHAMEPTIKDGERVSYDRYGGLPLHRGDIILFAKPEASGGTPLLKRVVGLPGETVRLQDGRVLIDGVPLDEPYLAPGMKTDPGSPQIGTAFIVPADSYFVLGDNRSASADSRSFGAVARREVTGVVKR